MNKQERAQLLDEWLRFYNDALRFGSDIERARQIADVLTFGTVQGAK